MYIYYKIKSKWLGIGIISIYYYHIGNLLAVADIICIYYYHIGNLLTVADIIADIVKIEVLCFIQNHVKLVPNASIVTVVSTFYSEDELSSAKVIMHKLCTRKLRYVEILRIITRKGENKRNSDAVDLMKLRTTWWAKIWKY